MANLDQVRMTIEFDLRADPVAGVVDVGHGRGQPFAGWMALTRVIERALQAARLDTPPLDPQGADDGR